VIVTVTEAVQEKAGVEVLAEGVSEVEGDLAAVVAGAGGETVSRGSNQVKG
jgi:hypothetical protein